ncbi:MAG: pilus assembly protein TadG-related protein, partial [Candidatus Binatia bacterium]
MVAAMLRIFEQLIAKAVRFAGDRGGNVALTFGIATLPLIGAVGAAVDYSHANSVKAAMQSALDSTALMLARDAPTMTDPNLDTKARSYFTALFTRPEATDIVVNATYSATTGSQVVVTGSAKVPTTIMSIAGYTTMTINGSSTAKWGSERLRVALALDNTGSMADHGKMTALKSATKSLLTQLQSAASVNGDVHVSIIPFSEDVNVGSSNYNASWLDWDEWEDENVRMVCSRRRCRSVALNHNQWNGCVADRGGKNGPTGQNYDQNVTAPNSSQPSKFPADQSDHCPVQMKG